MFKELAPQVQHRAARRQRRIRPSCRNKPATSQEASTLVKAERPKAARLLDPTPEPEGIHKEDTPVSDATQISHAGSDFYEGEEILREAYAEGEAEGADEAA